MRSLRVGPILLAGLLAACGGAQERTEQRLAAIQRQLEVLTEAAEGHERRIERLQDRLDLLEDKLEARALHGVPSGLPVVRLQPKPVEPPPEPASTEPPIEITQADLEAIGGAEPARRARREPVPPPPNAAFAGSLGVAPVPPLGGPGPMVGGGDADDPIGAYKRAYALYKGGDSAGALTAFEAFLRRWPRHDYADNALYWMGECRFARAEFAAALQTFRRVVSEHPTGNKVPDALLMIGMTLEKLGRPAEGRETLARLVTLFPDTAAARRAASHLGATNDGL